MFGLSEASWELQSPPSPAHCGEVSVEQEAFCWVLSGKGELEPLGRGGCQPSSDLTRAPGGAAVCIYTGVIGGVFETDSLKVGFREAYEKNSSLI